jgi:hypothetical protein
MGSLRFGVTQRKLKFVADMLDCSVRFVKPGCAMSCDHQGPPGAAGAK